MLPPESTAVVIGLHGMGGSAFYNSKLVEAKAKAFAEAGIAYMPIDGSGTGSQAESEIFESSLGKIDAAIGAVATRHPGITDVFLSGFSLGGIKVAAFAEDYQRMSRCAVKVAGVMMESPTNVVEWLRQSDENFNMVFAMAQQHAKGRPNTVVTRAYGLFDSTFTAGAFASLADRARPVNAYPYLRSIRVPLLVLAARNDPHLTLVFQNANNWAQHVKDQAPNAEVAVLGGEHSFEGSEREVARREVAFMQKALNRR